MRRDILRYHMKVKLLKEGAYALHSAWGPIVYFKKDDIYEGRREHCEQLMRDKWAVEFLEEEAEDAAQAPVTVDELEIFISGSISHEDDQKLVIQKWGKDNYDVNVSRAKSVENMLAELREIEKAKEEDSEDSEDSE